MRIMEIEKLKKQILREEMRRRRKNSSRPRTLICILLLLLLACSVGAYYLATLDQRLEARYIRGEKMVGAGEYGEAVEIFRGIHQGHGKFRLAPQALFRSAEVLNHYLERYHEAILAYLMVEKDYPDTDQARKAQEQVAEIYKNSLRDYGRAIVAYQKLLDSGAPDGDRIQYEVADSYFRLNNFEQARIEFESLLKNYPDSPLVAEVQYRIAVAYSLEGSSEEAEEAFRVTIEKWPGSPYTAEARFGLATVLEERDELKASLQILEELKGTYPNAEALAKKTDQVKERISKKKRAI
jgi:TolA-binding protein